jgi:hypothetical protein
MNPNRRNNNTKGCINKRRWLDNKHKSTDIVTMIIATVCTCAVSAIVGYTTSMLIHN